jgi:DnaJ-class molecular chaperone
VQPVEWAECLACRGSGAAPRERLTGAPDWRELAGMSERQCVQCGGRGRVSLSQRRSQETLARSVNSDADGPGAEKEACPACDGAGCNVCDGIGRVERAKAEILRKLI